MTENDSSNDHPKQSHAAPNFVKNWPPVKGEIKTTSSPFDEIAQKQKRDRQIVSDLKSKFQADRFASFSQGQIAEALEAIISQWGQTKIPLRECDQLCNLLDDVTAIGFLGKRIPILIGQKLERRFLPSVKNGLDTKNKQ